MREKFVMSWSFCAS